MKSCHVVPNLLKCYFKYITLCDAGQSHSPWRIQRGVMGSCPLFYKLKCPNITCYKLPKNQYLTIENFTQIWLGGERNFHRHPPAPLPPHTHIFQILDPPPELLIFNFSNQGRIQNLENVYLDLHSYKEGATQTYHVKHYDRLWQLT